MRTSPIGVALLVAVLCLPAAAGQGGDPTPRVAASADPVTASVALSQEAHPAGAAEHVVIGRVDDFADNLAATGLAGERGALLLTDGGPDAQIRPEVRAEVTRVLGGPPDQPCQGPADEVRVYLAGGESAVSVHVHQALIDDGWCVHRVGGASRVQTAILIAEVVGDASSTVLLARSDDWADAGAAGAWAALTRSRTLVTPSDDLHPDVRDALEQMAPDEIVLLGGEAALSAAVADAAGQIAPVRRLAGQARDGTAVAIHDQLWAAALVQGVALADGYGPDAWAWLFAAAPLAAQQGRPLLYGTDEGPAPASRSRIEPETDLLLIGPEDRVVLDPPPPLEPDLDAVQIGLEEIGSFASPMVLAPRPEVGELWIAERAGRIQALGGDGARTVLDIAATVSTNGERGLLGMAFDPDGSRIFTSSTDTTGASVVDEFRIDGDTVDASSRRLVIRVGQPRSNHNGGDLHMGPDGLLYWSLGDGGGADDQFGHGQRRDTLLGTIVRIDPDGGDPYGIPPGNPVEVDDRFAPEVWAFGLRNPFRMSFDSATGDLYIGDVGQNRVEEIDWLAAGTGSGANFGWSVFEGDRPFGGSALDGHVPPVFTETHAQGNCSITGGVVYRGESIPALHGAYVYSDLCRNTLRAIVVSDGVVTQQADLGVSIGSPVGFGVDHDGEVYVLSLTGDVRKLVPA